jgi:hypothetical protein
MRLGEHRIEQSSNFTAPRAFIDGGPRGELVRRFCQGRQGGVRNEWSFRAFRQKEVMPGVLIVEALAHAAALRCSRWKICAANWHS